MIEEPSLQVLLDISNHPTLSKRLTELIISTVSYGPFLVSSVNPPTALKLLQHDYATHESLIVSGQARDMLVEAFANLPNLRTIGLRDYDAKGRFRDGDDALWASYGHTFVDRDLSLDDHVHHIWILLLHAAGVADAKISNLEAFLRRDYHLANTAFDVLSARMARTIAPLLAGLKTLMLSLSEEDLSEPSPVAYVDADGATWSARYESLEDTKGCPVRFEKLLTPPNSEFPHLKKFLHHCPALEHLRLNFTGRTSPVLDWLAQSPLNSTVSHTQPSPLNYSLPISLPNIHTLDLGMVRIDSALLLKIFARFNLRKWNLWRITLDFDRPDVKPTSGNNAGNNAAADFLRNLAKASAMQNVERAMLGNLQVRAKDPRNARRYHVDFPPLGSVSGVDGKGARNSRRDSARDRRAQHQMIHFSLGGTYPDFASWAKAMADRATLKTLRQGVEISSESSQSDSDSSADGMDLGGDSDADEDDEEEEEEEE